MFIESPRMPECISFGLVSGPAFKTTAVVVGSGHEKRNVEWSLPLGRWDLSQAIKDEEDFELVEAHFMNAMGRAYGFRMKDWRDYRVVAGRGVVTGITTTLFQLQKTYPFGANIFKVPVRKPIAEGFVLKNSGVTLNTPADYTLDTTTGRVTTTIPRTAANLTWVGEFDKPVRFDTDELKAQSIDRTDGDKLLIQWASIPVLELRE